MDDKLSIEDWQNQRKSKLDRIAEKSIDFQFDINNPRISDKNSYLVATLAGMLYILSKNTRYEEYVCPVLEKYYDMYDCR